MQEEYEKARRELQEELAKGTSIDSLRSKLLKSEDVTDGTVSASSSDVEIPDELIQIQSYVRWEKAGKPNFSAEQQLVMFF